MADCMTDAGYTQGEQIRLDGAKDAALIRRTAAIANAISNAQQLVKNRKLQRDISDRSLKITEEQQAFTENVYWPGEEQMIQEYGNPEPIEDVEVLGRRYAGRMAATQAGHFAQAIHKAKCESGRYCVSQRTALLQKLEMERAKAIANAKILGRQIAFSEVQERIERNWKRKQQVIGLSKGLLGEAAAAMGEASKGFTERAQNLSARINQDLQRIGMADIDPGRSQEMNQILAQYSNRGRMPGVTSSQLYGTKSFDPEGQLNAITDSTQYNESVSSGVPIGDEQMMQGRSPWMSPIHETQMNKGRVGNYNLARSGTKIYTAVDSHGDVVNVPVSMNDFTLTYVDNKTQGDT